MESTWKRREGSGKEEEGKNYSLKVILFGEDQAPLPRAKSSCFLGLESQAPFFPLFGESAWRGSGNEEKLREEEEGGKDLFFFPRRRFPKSCLLLSCQYPSKGSGNEEKVRSGDGKRKLLLSKGDLSWWSQPSPP